jgi:hypothetical protein
VGASGSPSKVQCPTDEPIAIGGGFESTNAASVSAPIDAAGNTVTNGSAATGWEASDGAAATVAYAICSK